MTTPAPLLPCKGKTHDKRFPYPSSPCGNKSWKDGYCKIHHPDEKRKKQRARDAKRDKLFTRTPAPTGDLSSSEREEAVEVMARACRYGASNSKNAKAMLTALMSKFTLVKKEGV